MGWENILFIIAGITALIVFLPGINQRLRNSPKGSREDWLGLLFPIGLVVLFVLLLIKFI